MKKVFRPVNDTVVIKKIEVSSRSEGGIEIPEAAKGKSNEGFVVAVGPGRMLDTGIRSKPQVKVDDHVFFGGSYGGSEVKIDGRDYTMLREDEIFTVIEDAADEE